MASTMMICDHEGDLRLVLYGNQKDLWGIDSHWSDITLTDNIASLPNMTEAEKAATSVQVEALVSSAHLRLASKVFSDKLVEIEFAQRKARGESHIELALYDDDPKALQFVLDIIHGLPSLVPTKLKLRPLLRVAVVVHKYGLQEITHHFAASWTYMPNFRIQYERNPYPSLLSMIYIGWVFHKKDMFGRMTRMAQLNLSGRVEGYLEDGLEGLSMPITLTNKIEESRCSAIDQVIQMITHQINQQNDPRAHYCNGENMLFTSPQFGHIPENPAFWNLVIGSNCRGTTLKRLINGAKQLRLLPAPPHPYVNMSFSDLAKGIKSMEIDSLCEKTLKRLYQGVKIQRNCHDIRESFEAGLDQIKAGVEELKWEDYQ